MIAVTQGALATAAAVLLVVAGVVVSLLDARRELRRAVDLAADAARKREKG